MDIIKKIEKMMPEEVVTGDVAQNTAQGSVDVVGGECPDGYYYCPKKKKCMPKTDESSISGAITGSGQTRVVGQKDKYISVVRRNPRPLKFSKLTGAYIPPVEDIDPYDEEIQEAFGFGAARELKKYVERIKKSWHGLDVEWDNKEKAIHVFAGTKNIMDTVAEWAKDRLPLKFKVLKSQGVVTIKV